MRDEADTSDLPRDSYPPLVLTGERTLPGVVEENYWFQRHLVAYNYLLPLVEGKRVLDLGSGEGYGVDLLASRAVEAVGVDLAPEAIYHARKTYRRPNLRFLYKDIYNNEIEPSAGMLKNLDGDYKVIIVGDAYMAPSELMSVGGAIDYYYHNETPGHEWLSRIADHFRHCVWLNPLPQMAWVHPTIKAIGQVFPMYPLTLDGVEEAVRKLIVKH